MYLGIDLGSSGLKAVLVDDCGHLVGSARQALSFTVLENGGVEQDPESWLAACVGAIDELAATHASALKRVRGIGFSGQMHGATLVDADGQAIRDCLLWNDTRAVAQAKSLMRSAAFVEQTGNLLFPGFTAPKVEWVREHEPHHFDRIHKVLLPKDYLRLRLTGEYATDMSDASGTGWLNVAQRDWDHDLLRGSRLSVQHMPDLYEGNQQVGQLLTVWSQRWGFATTPKVVAGAGDNAATACGLGLMNEGCGFVSLGTSGVVFAPAADHRPAPDKAVHAFCHAMPHQWHQMGVTLCAADALSWASRLVDRAPSDLAGLLSGTTGPGTGMFLPYLMGERTPHNRADIRGAWLGISAGDDAVALSRAVVDGVNFSLRDCLESITASGTQVNQLVAAGGGSQSQAWLQRLANGLNRPIRQYQHSQHAAALGAARLAGAPVTKLPIKAEFLPDPKLAPVFEAAFHRYQAAAELIKEWHV